MSSIWSYVALLSLVLGGAFFFWRKAAGSGARKEREKQHEASDKAEEANAEDDAEYERLRRNKSRREQLLDLIRKARGSGD